MRITKSVVFGLVSLVCTVTATKVAGKPVLAKRQELVTVTVVNGGCTAICKDVTGFWGAIATSCGASCDTGFPTSMPATSTSTSISTSTEISTVTSNAKAAVNQRAVVSTSSGDCSWTCSVNEVEDDYDCDLECGGSPSTSMPVTSTSTQAALNQRTVISAVDGDCTAICWDLMPGTECDVQCSSDFKTKVPVPSKAAHIANLVARENVQAHQVHEARLARKFGGLLARHDTMTVTVTSIPEYCTAGPESFISTTVAGIPTILPMQVPQKAGVSGFSAALSQASAALSAVEQAQGGATGNLSVASSALSEASALSSMASSLLSEVMSEAISEASASSSSVAATAAPASAGSAPTVSATTTATSTSSETTTASTTTTGSQVVSEAGTAISTSVPITGAAPEFNVSIWLVLSLFVGLAANAAFLI